MRRSRRCERGGKHQLREAADGAPEGVAVSDMISEVDSLRYHFTGCFLLSGFRILRIL